MAKAVKVHKGTVLHHFGSVLGLKAAAAALAYAELADELDTLNTSARNHKLLRPALIHARFAVNDPTRYAALHDRAIWPPPDTSQNKTERDWQMSAAIEKANALNSYHEFISKRLKESATTGDSSVSATALCEALTSMVDGFTFQQWQESPQLNESKWRQLRKVARYCRFVLNGAQIASGKSQKHRATRRQPQ